MVNADLERNGEKMNNDEPATTTKSCYGKY